MLNLMIAQRKMGGGGGGDGGGLEGAEDHCTMPSHFTIYYARLFIMQE